jgi:predicted metalloprotease with PDZ domain
MTETFTVDCTDAARHLYRVTLHLEGLAPGTHDLALPVWAPGAYVVQDFSRHLFDVSAVDAVGQPLSLTKVAKNVWRFDAADAATIVYHAYAFQLADSGMHADATHAYWNGTNIFFMVDGVRDVPIDLYVRAPEHWQVSTGLDRVDGHPFHFRAPDYDILVDCPVEVGTHRRYGFEVRGKPHEVAIWGYGNENPDRLVDDLRTIVAAFADMMGGLPYAHYTFIVHIVDLLPGTESIWLPGWGGLEHLNSTTCGVTRTAFKPWSQYKDVLYLFAHEFFHLWNVKRIHPDMLGPFDYNREVYTRLLWAMEGLTDYYAYLVCRRAGLYTVDDYLTAIAEQIQELEKVPGRARPSLAASSFDSWISFTHPTPDFDNRSVSYYLKGGLVGLLLDLEIRRRTGGRKALHHVLTLLMERYGDHGVGFPEPVYRATVEEVAGGSMADFFARYIEGVEELPFDEALTVAGLELHRRVQNPDRRRPEQEKDAPGDEASDAPYGWLGIAFRQGAERPEVGRVSDPGPSAALVHPGDEIVAVDTIRVRTPDDLTERIRANYPPGTAVSLHLFRRGRLETVTVTVGEAPPNVYRIRRSETATEEQRAVYKDWLNAAWD